MEVKSEEDDAPEELDVFAFESAVAAVGAMLIAHYSNKLSKP